MEALRDRVVTILRQHGPLRTPEVEMYLKARGDWLSDTFDVRDAVSGLVESGVAEFVHPGYYVKLKEI